MVRKVKEFRKVRKGQGGQERSLGKPGMMDGWKMKSTFTTFIFQNDGQKLEVKKEK